jgi:hypothetical protein
MSADMTTSKARSISRRGDLRPGRCRLDDSAELLCHQRHTEIVPLAFVTALGAKECELVVRFDTVGTEAKVEALAV